jgi:hypothetical protein
MAVAAVVCLLGGAVAFRASIRACKSYWRSGVHLVVLSALVVVALLAIDALIGHGLAGPLF